MAEDYEIAPVSDNPEGSEASNAAVEQVAEKMREAAKAAAAQAKKEGKVKKADNAVVDLLVKALQKTQDDMLLKLIVASLQENTPSNLVLATVSPLYDDIFQAMPAEGDGLFVDNTWPEEEREKMRRWEKVMLTSLDNQKKKFHKVLNENDGSLPAYTELLNLVIQRISEHESVSGAHILSALIEHTAQESFN